MSDKEPKSTEEKIKAQVEARVGDPETPGEEAKDDSLPERKNIYLCEIILDKLNKSRYYYNNHSSSFTFSEDRMKQTFKNKNPLLWMPVAERRWNGSFPFANSMTRGFCV